MPAGGRHPGWRLHKHPDHQCLVRGPVRWTDAEPLPRHRHVEQPEPPALFSAEPSFRLIPEDDITEEKEVIESALEQTSADAILTTRLVDIAREESYIPPGYDFAPVGFYDYYYPTYRMMFRPGYVVTNTTVILETNVYSAVSGDLLWTGTTRSFNPVSADSVVNELAALLVGELAARGFITRRQ